MAHLRVTVVFIAALAACDQAGAQAGAVSSGITPPAGWQPLPDVARAAADAAKADGVRVAGTEAWGETSRGCYAVWLRLTGANASAERVIAGIASEKLETKDIVKPTTEDGTGIVSLAFAKTGYAGRLRARVESGGITALACFSNERERIACDSACTVLLGSLP